MATLQALLKAHLEQRNLSVKTFAERLGISYPTVLALINRGSVPRSQEHRDILRRELSIPADRWAAVIASSMKDGIDIPTDGPLDLQQLVTREILAQGYTELSLAEKSGIPYPTLLGVTRKGAIPRGDTLSRLGELLGIAAETVEAAVALSRNRRSQAEDEPVPAPQPGVGEAGGPSLAQLSLDAVTRSGISTAAYARQHHLPYISLSKLIREGHPPADGNPMLAALRTALGLSEGDFAAALKRSRENPQPASRAKSSEIAVTPMQASLQKVVDERGLSIKAFAELADLSVLTATRLLKRGDLPGRQTTHAKLRALLGLGEGDYQLLLQRSRAAGAQVADDDDAPAQTSTEQFLRPTSVTVSLPGDGTAALVQSSAAPSDEDLMALIRRLGPRQRRSLMSFLKSLVPEDG